LISQDKLIKEKDENEFAELDLKLNNKDKRRHSHMQIKDQAVSMNKFNKNNNQRMLGFDVNFYNLFQNDDLNCLIWAVNK